MAVTKAAIRSAGMTVGAMSTDASKAGMMTVADAVVAANTGATMSIAAEADHPRIGAIALKAIFSVTPASKAAVDVVSTTSIAVAATTTMIAALGAAVAKGLADKAAAVMGVAGSAIRKVTHGPRNSVARIKAAAVGVTASIPAAVVRA